MTIINSKIFQHMAINRILIDFISLFYPRTCINCQRALISKEKFLCLHCKLSLPVIEQQYEYSSPLKNRLKTITNLQNVYAYLRFNKGGVAQKLLYEVKYHGQEELAVSMGQWFAHEMIQNIKWQQIDMIIPIPLHRAKYRRRGFNQSELIAKGLSEILEIPLRSRLLERIKHTSTQTKKGKTERWMNVNQIFQLKQEFEVSGKHLLLVDDVITTGATIESASRLFEDKDCKVSIACVATGQ